jgi:hypothetical protein
MAVVVICVLLVLAGIVAVVRWGDLPVQAPPAPEADPATRPPPGLVVRRYLWHATLALTSGVGAGILAAGAGGRLVMRLLAVTAGPRAQGQLTEAAEVVGRISVGGTIGFFLFVGVFTGLLSAAAYLLLRRWLPGGRAGGLVFGALLLVVAGTRVDPLRDNNPDFSLVGPPWLAVTAFVALGGRYSRALPLLSAQPRTIAAYAPLLLLVPLFLAIPVIVALGLVTLVAAQVRPLVAAWRDRRAVVAGRIVLAVAALVALPGFVSALATILDPG